MTAFATLDELKASLDWTLDSGEEQDAIDALDSLSEQARYYGRATWSLATAPRLAKKLVMSAAKRYLRNPEGYTTSRAGDETVSWTDRGSEDAGSAHFTKNEIKMLKGMGGYTGIASAPVVAWGTADRSIEGRVPVSGWPGEKPFPYFSSDREPW